MIQLQARSKEIQQLLADDNLNRAIRRLLDFIRDFVDDSDLQSEVILVSANHKKFVREERQNLLDFNLASQIRSRIINQILQVHKEACALYKNNHKAEPQETIAIKQNTAVTKGNAPIKEIKDVSSDLNQVDQKTEAVVATPNKELDPGKSDSIIFTKKLSKEYKKTGFKLNDINIDLQKNEILGVIGENGNGKTTLFRILTGELKHDSGAIQFPIFGENNPNKLDWIKIKHNIAYVEQELPKWHGYLKDNLHYEASLSNIRGKLNSKEIEFIIHRLGLVEHIDKKWHELSGGYKLRFSLAKALIKKPKILVLDEPLANLDINAQALVLNDLRDLANSIKYPVSIVVSSQHLHEVEYIADKILFIKNGNTVFYGKKSDLGNNRKYNFFEIQTSLSKDELFETLKNIKLVDIIYDSMYVQLVTPLEITGEMVIKELLNKKIALTYFRDISKSTKKMFV